MAKYIIQLVVSIIFFLLSSFATWYEGSEILERPWEWEYSTHFSHILNNEVANTNDISQVDFFVYAAKTKPLFPFLMVISLFYLIILVGKILLKENKKGFIVFLFIFGCLLLLMDLFFFKSPTLGGEVFTITFGISGIMCLLFSLLFYLGKINRLKD